MDRETKLARYEEFTEAICAVEAINGPWREMQKALWLLNAMREECMDGDAISGTCEGCGERVLESEGLLHCVDDGVDLCPECLEDAAAAA